MINFKNESVAITREPRQEEQLHISYKCHFFPVMLKRRLQTVDHADCEDLADRADGETFRYLLFNPSMRYPHDYLCIFTYH